LVKLLEKVIAPTPNKAIVVTTNYDIVAPKYLDEGENFVPKYREMLKRTPTETVEDAASIVGIDLTDPSFWENGLKTIYDSIDEFIKNTSV